MKNILQFIPALVLLYFAGFERDNIAAAQWGLISSVVCYALIAVIQQFRLNKQQLAILLLTIIMCALTWWLKDDRFIRLKAPVVFSIQALVFWVSPYFGQARITLAERILGSSFKLSAPQWMRVNYAWVVYSLVCAAANAYVAFEHPLYWAQFKVFGSMAITIVFIGALFYRLRDHILTPQGDA